MNDKIRPSMTFALLLCRVQDGDGEFLLIEAANSLPRWMKPETAENRVSVMTGSSFMLECIIHQLLQDTWYTVSDPKSTP